MSTRTWGWLTDTYHDRDHMELSIGGWAENNDLGLTIRHEDADEDMAPYTVDLDTETAIAIAAELFRRVGMSELLMDTMIREAVRMLREADALPGQILSDMQATECLPATGGLLGVALAALSSDQRLRVQTELDHDPEMLVITVMPR